MIKCECSDRKAGIKSELPTYKSITKIGINSKLFVRPLIPTTPKLQTLANPMSPGQIIYVH